MALAATVVDDRGRGPGAKPKARASSFAKGASAPLGDSYEADNAVDGNARTVWLAAENDAKRELSVQYAKSLKCERIVIHAALLAPLGAAALARPTELELVLNGKAEHKLTFGADPTQPLELRLDPPVAVKRLDLKLTSIASGASSPLVGIGEVELYEE